MSNNGNESSEEDTEVARESSDDGYSDDGFEYRYYIHPMMYYIPKEKRSAVRKISKDTARVYGNQEPVRRRVRHYPIVQDQEETCMQENCNKITSAKCDRCHVFLCMNSENDCFTKFHEY